jgi:hypothetical protein
MEPRAILFRLPLERPLLRVLPTAGSTCQCEALRTFWSGENGLGHLSCSDHQAAEAQPDVADFVPDSNQRVHRVILIAIRSVS